MLNRFDFCLNTNFIFGIDAEKQIGKKIKEMNVRRVLLHYGDGAEMPQTKRNEIKSYIEAEGIAVVELGGVKANPTLEIIREGIQLCKTNQVDFVLGIGGGSVIDSAKAIALGALYEGDVWDFYSYKIPVEKALPIGAVITYPATGSESSNASVITNEETQQKVGLQSQPLRPSLAIMNPEFTYTLPRKLAAAGIADIYSHVVEEYFNDTDQYGVMDQVCEAIFRSILDIGLFSLDHPEDYNTKSELLWIATIANDGLLDIGRIPEWSSHAIGHQLGASYNVNHGVSLAIIMPAWMQYVYRNNIGRFARYAETVFGCSAKDRTKEEIALEGIQKTKEFFASLGLPTGLKMAGIPTNEFPKMARHILKSKCGTFGSVKQLDEDDIVEIFKLAI